MAYVVKRQVGYCEDYLTGFDVIWGPVWCMAQSAAKRFPTMDRADAALFDAADIMRPKPWFVPNYGGATTLWSEKVTD